jgi:hypothetical protein
VKEGGSTVALSDDGVPDLLKPDAFDELEAIILSIVARGSTYEEELYRVIALPPEEWSESLSVFAMYEPRMLPNRF